MNTKRWDVLIAAVLCAGLGIASGFYAARQSGSSSDGEVAAPPAGGPADDHTHFTDESLRNMGVTYGVVTPTTSAVTRGIVATVVATERTLQPVQAPIGGVVTEVAVEPGQFVPAGGVVAHLVRDPIARPELLLTQEYTVPGHDELHRAIRDMREAHTDATIARAELERIAQFTGSAEEAPVLPLQRRIDLEYQLQRAELRREVAAHELERHGFSDEQVEALCAGEHVELFDAEHTQRALAHGGLWRGNASRLLAALPQHLRRLPTVVATVAELAANGLDDAEVCAWLEADGRAGESFVEVAALLLRGSSAADVQRLCELGALAPSLELRAPAIAADWDVASVAVRPGDRVNAGDGIVTLRDPRALRLRAEPVGSEVEELTRAVREQVACRAVPLVPGSGPEVDGLVVDYVGTTEADPRPVAWVRLQNTPQPGRAEDDVRYRTWELQPGMRYRLLVPTRALDGVYALPRSAVTEDGPDHVVFVPTGDGGFREVPVVIVHEDEDRILVAADGALEPGTRIVMRGAFEIGLALHAGDQAMEHDHH